MPPGPAGEGMLKLTDVSKSYATAQGPLPVLRGVSLELPPGRSLALTGESGSGKSTLLHLVAGLGNLGFQARIAGRHDPDWQAELVRRLTLSDLLTRYPEQLSGGQQQRV